MNLLALALAVCALPAGSAASLPGDAPVCLDSSQNCIDAPVNWEAGGSMLEYTANANPAMTEVPVRIFPASLHQTGKTQLTPLDLSEALSLPYPATAPNLLASFIEVKAGESLETGVEHATSQSFYVMRGKGSSVTRAGLVEWSRGDLFVLPYLGDTAPSVCHSSPMVVGRQCVRHVCESDDEFGSCSLYFVHDEPLLQYLGARPVDTRRFQPAMYPGTVMLETVGNISPVDEFTGEVRNRRGILLSSQDSTQTKTLTPTLWSLLNSIEAGATQAPHRHNSVALDLAVVGTVPSVGGAEGDGTSGGIVYTLLGRELDANGAIVRPLKVEWESGGVFVTPPGWWHSHHNEGNSTAWVLPMQDAGLYTHQRTLDIRFQAEETQRLQNGVSRGATLDIQKSDIENKVKGASKNVRELDEQEGGSETEGDIKPLVAGTIMFGHCGHA
uniref:Cupin type-1 domain-containing protein n=1 Tax=Florenciella parvula TaxID=236787 RepID=A0A7S2BSN0_9STRA|mmetsp:Transcript_20070/g.42292  ORF Transcript_20070/g.42292 Transcript_20070/m.42292 type:complete len:443 (+) Transcript_20070:131-1459(+)|eukprot:CAMPEP_0182524208 /NCGR_PEP_ID=MMETSP1323-20130603/1619_1 /TAXON_ID=236787 /ORGANISM="Florenciella parvula, Strain RCC1693" /LENGTH=442 /DNA_ID=CAMNT_0024732727 /DNA_START=212 /DNA_END=1540 /DNA_ORIENTATION=+